MRLFLSVLLLSLTAMATPEVGEKASYQGVLSSDGESISLTLDLAIIQHNAATNEYLVEKTVNLGEGPMTEQDWEAAKDFHPDETIKNYLDLCRQSNRLEMISVPAGTFESCKEVGEATDDNGNKIGTTHTWIGLVPIYRVIKTITNYDDGSSFTIEATSF